MFSTTARRLLTPASVVSLLHPNAHNPRVGGSVLSLLGLLLIIVGIPVPTISG